ncbi:MAG: hypothetical protein CO065_01970 [Comamonadaceae bacterium CG_4_9_14_0_8_um_filter_57_21]|nr:MAG: hypothetical protein COY49_04885 [Comamonadaceae bacterium CG_4_10_14_0_8_um_filter_57_29]PJC21897.1 MAG: hypothetical protein CO065_01970 [Comamonadaceae bacterium CG_4_9_14_0_8_um_filter_57_21]
MKKQIDWAWANSLRSLAIFEAATLSLGFELNSFAPVGQRFTNREVNEPPAEYRERVILAYEAARDDSLKVMGRTAARGEAYDPLAGFDDGQLWDVAPADFRRWCDAEGFAVPAEWVPRDYSKEVPAPTEPASKTPAQIAKRRSWLDVTGVYVAEILRTGQYANAKALFNALESKAGTGSPFDRGVGANRGSLFVRELSQTLKMKTVQNNWEKLLKTAAKN